MNLKETWDKHRDEEFLHFERVSPKQSNRPDLNAFLLLDRLIPGTRDIVSAAQHDEIFLDVDVHELETVISEPQIIELIRCGVRFEADTESLAMFA